MRKSHVLRMLAVLASLSAGLDAVATPLGASQDVVGYAQPVPESNLLGAPARLRVEDAGLEQALQALRMSSGVSIAYSPTLLSQVRDRVTCFCLNATVREALLTILAGTDFEPSLVGGQVVVRMRGSDVALTVGEPPIPPDVPVAGQVTGLVTAIQGLAPLSGVQVYLAGTGLGSLTNAQGRYLILNVPAGEHEVHAELIGYAAASQTVSVVDGRAAVADFQLAERAFGLDEIVVTGTPGEQQLRSLGNTVGRIDVAERMRDAPAPSFQQLLEGASPGMNVDFGGQGRVGGGAVIRIRGASSIALGSQPLLYIDGVRVNNEYAAMGPGTTQNSPPSRWDDLNPEVIESIEVIKGPAAATLYGTEASNGVINIITKRGARGDPQVSLRIGHGANFWWDGPERSLATAHYVCQGIADDHCMAGGTRYEPGEIVEFNVLQEDRLRGGNEWFRTGRPQSYGATVEGGAEALRYYAAVDWAHDEGVVSWDWKNQLNGRMNLTYTPDDELDIRFGIGGVSSEHRDPLDRIYLGINRACRAPGCEGGSGGGGVDGISRGYFIFTPDALKNSFFGYERVVRSMYNLQVNHRPNEWLSHRVTTGIDWTRLENSALYLPTAYGHSNLQGSKQELLSNTDYLSLDYSATATFPLTQSLTSATSSGVQYYRKSIHNIYAEGSRFAVKGLETISAGGVRGASEDFVENKTLGVYLQEQLSWQDRVFLTVAARGDDNSAFGENFEFVLYPKVSASWVVSEESIFEGMIPWLDQLRLRAAWGKAGQQPDAFASIRTYSPFSAPGGTVALTPQNAGNPDLKPEVEAELEMGVDASLFGSRLSAEFTYYSKERDDAIIAVPTRPSEGFPGLQYKNLGEIVNSGIEVQLDAQLVQRSDLGVNLSLSFSRNSNRITSMAGIRPQLLEGRYIATSWAQQLFAEGFPLGSIWLKKVVSADVVGTGADATAGNVLCEGGDVLPISSADFPISRGGGAPVPCAEAPNIFAGTPLPTRHVSAATTVTLFDNRLSLSAQVDYSGGHRMIDGDIAARHLIYRNSRAILERSDPILLGYESIGRDGLNQAGYYDASFARLRRISATYNFPASWVEGFGAERMSLSLSLSNPWIIWRATERIFGERIIEPEARFTTHEGSDPGGLHAGTQDVAPNMQRLMALLRVTL